VTNLADLVRTTAQRRPDAGAMTYRGTTTTWAALDADVDAAAAGLLDLDLHVGDRVALVVPNSLTFVSVYFGILRAGLVAVPIDIGYTSREIAAQLGDSHAKVVICSPSTEREVDEAVATTRRVVVTDGASYDALLASGRPAGRVTSGGGGESLAVLLYTSGTSGRPKGAMLSHRALLANIDQCLRLDPLPMTADDVVLLALPLTHVYALNAVLGLVAATGARAVLMDRFDPASSLQLIEAERVTNVPAVPTMYIAWAAQPDVRERLAGVRLLVSGAAPLPPVVFGELRTALGRPVYEGYGLTETAPVVSSTMASPAAKPGSVGRPVPGVEVKLIDGETGAEVEEDDPGEIFVRGANLFSGYWPDGQGGPTQDGWWATGDVAYADEEGDLFLVDRRKELVIVSGFNVFPREVEDVIEKLPGVAEVAVIGVPHPTTGEAVKAYIVPLAEGAVTADDVTRHCATQLARFKRPTIIEIVARLPHSATGKVAKGQLRDSSA
jgi:long-chain acyl-CoA synthetase